MAPRTLAEVRAADADVVYSLYFPDDGRMRAATAVGCVCLDYLTCRECERILGQSFLSIELAVRKKQRTDPPVPVARIDAGPRQRVEPRTDPPVPVARIDAGPRQRVEPGSHGAEGSDKVAISGKANQLGLGSSHPPSDGIEGSDAEEISGKTDKLGPGSSHPPSDGAEGSDKVAISGKANQLGPGSSHPPSDGIEGSDAVAISGKTDKLGPGSSYPPSDGVEGSDAVAIFGKADKLGSGSSHPPSDGIEGSDAVENSGKADPLGPGSSHPPSDGIEGSDAVAISGKAEQLGPGSSHPPSDGVQGSDALAISGKVDRLGPGSHSPSDGVEVSDAAIPGTADRLGPGSHAPSNGVEEGFEAAISRMAARLGLAGAVGERAKEIFRKMEEASAWPRVPGRRKNKTKFQSKRPLAYAACLSIACRADGSAVTLRELARAVAEDGGAAGRKDIANLVAHIRGRLGKEEDGQAAGGMAVSISSYLRRFGALVGLREPDLAAAMRAARRLEDGALDLRHSPDTVAAAVVCLALERAGAMRPGVKDVAAATGVSSTVHLVCRKLRCHVDLLFG